jgi:hypothetical protein
MLSGFYTSQVVSEIRLDNDSMKDLLSAAGVRHM